MPLPSEDEYETNDDEYDLKEVEAMIKKLQMTAETIKKRSAKKTPSMKQDDILDEKYPDGARSKLDFESSAMSSNKENVKHEAASIKLETIMKTAPKLSGEGDFLPWRKGILDIAQWRKWPNSLLENKNLEQVKAVKLHEQLQPTEMKRST